MRARPSIDLDTIITDWSLHLQVLTGVAAAEYAGPAIVLSFLISGIGCGFSALCYAELSSMVPVAGSAYAFAVATLGELPGFIIGWDLMLEYLFGASAVAVGWSSYVRSGLRDIGIVVPPGLASAPVAFDIKTEKWLSTDGGIDALAITVVLLTSAIQIRGIAESARFNTIVVVLKIVVLLIFIFVGAGYVRPQNYTPFVPESTGTFGVYGWSGVLRGSSVVFFSYIGFDALSTNAGEAIDPQRTVPLATIICLGVCTALYIATAAVMTGMANYTKLSVADPIAVAVDAAGPDLLWLRPVVKLGAVLGLTSVVMVQMLGQARVFWAMADDGLLPKVFAKVHPKYRTPYVTTTFTAIVASFICGLLPIDILGEMVSIGTLFAFTVVCAGVIVLRRTQPELPRPFKTPYSPWVPLLGMITSMAQMAALPAGTWIRFIVWLLLGLLVFYFYSRKHAKPYALRRAMLLGLTADGQMDPARHGSASLLQGKEGELAMTVTNSLRIAASTGDSSGVRRPSSGAAVYDLSAAVAAHTPNTPNDIVDAYTAAASLLHTNSSVTKGGAGAGGSLAVSDAAVEDWSRQVHYSAVNLPVQSQQEAATHISANPYVQALAGQALAQGTDGAGSRARRERIDAQLHTQPPS